MHTLRVPQTMGPSTGWNTGWNAGWNLAAMVNQAGKWSKAKPAARPKMATPASLAVPRAVI